MSDKFRALLISKTDDRQSVDLVDFNEADLMDGDVTIDVEYSTINYKDGLALTGKAPVVRRFPLIPGIDCSGTVRSSQSDEFAPGDKVILTGWGVGEGHFGGLSQRARVKSDWLIKMPGGMSSYDAMAIGTAGYTAMLCVMALEDNGVTPDSGEVLVTGATGGVGSVAIAILSGLGFDVAASTGRVSEGDYLKGLGAKTIIDREEFNTKVRPLAKTRWAGGVDAVGSTTLANVLSQVNYGGTVAACGLAQGMDLPSSVAPFILRAVKLIGIDSVMSPKPLRQRAWARLAKDLDVDKLKTITRQINLADAPQAGTDIIAGKIKGRVVVDVNG